MSDQSGKSRTLRIRLDYHKHGGLLHWSRWACAMIGLICSGSYAAYVLAGVFSDRKGNDKSPSSWLDSAVLQVNTGPLAKVHAHFEKDCRQCHADSVLQPIASDAFKLAVQASVNSLSEKCQQCHAVQSHVARIATAACIAVDQNCAECHQDHQGREVDLAAVTTRKCTQCHSNLNRVCGDSANLAVNANIDQFSIESHATKSQTFRSLSSDPGRIKFSHAQHMNLGQVKSGHRGGFQLSMMTERSRGKYTGVGENEVVQLSCSNCHKLQTPAGEVAFEQLTNTTSATDIELSHSYAPIRFDEHCAACHQFTFTGQTAVMTPLPHAATKEDFGQILSSRLVGGKLNGQIAMRTDSALGTGESHVQNLVESELKTSVDKVYSGCSKCHTDDMSAQFVSRKPMLPRRWLEYGYFDHGAHEKISACAFCHVIPESEESTASATVMIKGPESCTPCHRSGVNTGSAVAMTSQDLQHLLGDARQPSLASDQCTLCHRYHWSRPQPDDLPNASEAVLIGTAQ